MIDVVCGARPNFMKVDPIIRNMDPAFEIRIVHTGQHYDHAMSQSFFDVLGLPRPDINLEVGSGSQAKQTAQALVSLDDVYTNRRIFITGYEV